MVFSLRLPKKLEQGLARAAKAAGTTKSDYVRRCLEEKLAQPKMTLAEAYEMGKDLFGKHGSGRGDLSRNTGQIAREIMRAKASRRRHRTSGRAV